MDLTPEQKKLVAQWVAGGDNLSVIQSKLGETFKISMTYMDVRFLVDDLNLELKDPKPTVSASDVTKSPAKPAPAKEAGEKKGFLDKVKEKVGLGSSGQEEALPPEAEDEEMAMEDEVPGAAGSVTVDVDKVVLIPGALASGSVTFSDGITARWIVDQYGRPGFTEVSKPGYRPTPTDAQAFMKELSAALQRKGF